VNPRLLIALVLASVFLLGAVVLAATRPGSDDDDPAAGKLRFEGAAIPDGVRAPGFALTDQDGAPIRMSDFEDTVIVTFLYTDCDESCPPQAQQIKGALVELGDDERVPAIAIALVPEEDTPESAREFLDKQGMRGKLDFVLGSREQLERLWRGYYIQPQTEEVEHQARIVLVDEGYQRVGYPLEQATPERIAHDVRELRAN
jgi:protein SCO1/2